MLLLFEHVLLILKIENEEYKYKGHIKVSDSMHLA